jgi:hypothetical protein
MTWNYIQQRKKKFAYQQAMPSRYQVVLFYRLYSGLDFPIQPHLFLKPSEACAWAISCFFADGLPNIWGQGNLTEFLHFVGTVAIDSADIKILDPPHFNSLLKAAYFKDVLFFPQ